MKLCATNSMLGSSIHHGGEIPRISKEVEEFSKRDRGAGG